jgi:hypothetical protein
MCLIVNHSFHKKKDKKGFPLPLRAKKDIKVVKALMVSNGKYYSPVKGFIYHPGFIYSITNKKQFGITKNKRFSGGPQYEIGRGFHSFSNGGKYFYTLRKIIFIIPKGALYYRGTDGDWVSNKIYFPEPKRKLIK